MQVSGEAQLLTGGHLGLIESCCSVTAVCGTARLLQRNKCQDEATHSNLVRHGEHAPIHESAQWLVIVLGIHDW